MATNITEAAQNGYDHLPETNPHIERSPNYYGFEAGRRMEAMGYTKPTKATMGRGYSVNVWTASNQFKATFYGRQMTIERI